MLIENSKNKIKNEGLVEFEGRLKISLPKDYRNFLLENNGGSPTPNTFEFFDQDGQESDSLVHFYYAIYNKNEYDNLEQNYLFLLSENRIPSNILPIAEDPFGNMICVSVSGNNYGKVYFWDHELEVQNASYDNLSLIANNFNDFLNNLHENEEI